MESPKEAKLEIDALKKKWSPDQSPKSSPKGSNTARIVEFGKSKRLNESFAQVDPTNLIFDLRNQNNSPRQGV
jgi:hypothetical protein